MKVDFVKLNPTQNMTLIVTTPVPREEQAGLAARLMEYGSVYAEQVGFLEEPTLRGVRARLQMMGGEFCGNASMSMAALLAREDDVPEGARMQLTLEVSGADGPVSCRVIRRKQGKFSVAVEMPLPLAIDMVELLPGEKLPLVRFPGIAQVIVPEGRLDALQAQARAAKWCEMLSEDALGILLVSKDMRRMRPLVAVRSTKSAVWEHGCGSGSAAVGAYLTQKLKKGIELAIDQPGGTIIVRTAYAQERLKSIEIEGIVHIAAMGEAYIDE